jgi:hypothetical protein
VGSVNINDTITHFAIPNLPFGGIKQSGSGRAHGEEDVRQFSQTRAYVVGGPPLPFDLATVMRQPGNYKLGSAIMHLAFGVTPQQRIRPIIEALTSTADSATTSEPSTQPSSLSRPKLGNAATVIGLAATALALILGLSRSRKEL